MTVRFCIGRESNSTACSSLSFILHYYIAISVAAAKQNTRVQFALYWMLLLRRAAPSVVTSVSEQLLTILVFRVQQRRQNYYSEHGVLLFDTWA